MAIVNHCLILSPSFPQGHIDLTGVGKRGYHIPRKGTVQVVSVTCVMVKIEVCVCGGGVWVWVWVCMCCYYFL